MGSQVSWCLFLVMIAVFLNVEFSRAEDTKIHVVLLGEVKHNDPEHVTDSHLRMLESVLGSKQDASDAIVHTYRHGFSGFAAHLTDAQAKKMSEHPDVVHMSPNTEYHLQTTRAFDYLGLSQSLPKGLIHDGKMGEDVIIGVFDSGVWPESPSFSDEGLGPIPARWKGQCVDGQGWDSKKHCNKKIIGARFYMEGLLKRNRTDTGVSEDEVMSAREKFPHGTHVASTAVGAFVANVTDSGFGPAGSVRGGAPKARLAIYKVCWLKTDASCASGDILKAFDDAVADGVDVITISMGRPNPIMTEVADYNQLSFGAFHAVSKGITVLSAGGNYGPQSNTIQNISPWIITVAASGMDRWYPTPMSLGNGVPVMARSPYDGGDIQGSLAFIDSPEEITADKKGKVLLAFVLDTGDTPIDYIMKFSYGETGARALILAAPIDDVVIKHDDTLPTLYVDYETGSVIYKYLKTVSNPTIKISNSIEVTGPVVATRIAKFSGRGPNSINPYVLKPDITAPGMGIVAAVTPEKVGSKNGYSSMAGTSMATPMVAGIVALLKSAHPDWSPAAIKSALITTASTTDPYGEPIFAQGVSRKIADPFDYGGGLVNPNKAVDPGLVYDANMEDYRRFLCAANYDEVQITKISMFNTHYNCPNPRPPMHELNLPSITLPYLKEDVTVTRTVTNVGPVNSNYKLIVKAPLGITVSVSPKKLHFNSTTKKLNYSVTFHTTHRSNTIYYFGSLIWADHHRNINVTIPLSVRTQMLLNFDN